MISIGILVGLLQALFVFYPRLHGLAILLIGMGVAWQAGRFGAGRPLQAVRLARWTAGVLMLVPLGGALITEFLPQWRERRALARSTVPEPSLPNVLLVFLDTVRGDHLSLYGYPRPTTPRLEHLARGGVVFEQAIATAPWTLPSHTSVFTGLWPHEMTADWRSPLDGRVPTLAEAFRDAGYHTGGFVANVHVVGWESGLDRGFLHFEDYALRPSQAIAATAFERFLLAMRPLQRRFGKPRAGYIYRKPAKQIRDDFLHWLQANRGSRRPFFGFLNFYDAHDPYLPSREFLGRFGGPASPWNPARPRQYSLPQIARDSSVRAPAIALYDEAIATLDATLGDIFDELARAGELDRTIVAVTSDHGEHFGDRGMAGHGCSLYEPLLRVPLLLVYPPAAPANTRISVPVSLRDLGPTLLDLAGVEPARKLPGLSLRALWSEGGATGPGISAAISEVSGGPGELSVDRIRLGDLASLTTDSLKFIRNGDGSEELYDLIADPLETTPLPGPVPRHLRERLDRLVPRAWSEYGRARARGGKVPLTEAEPR